MRRTPTTKKIPTPMPMVQTMTVSSTPIWPLKTERSGSATVTSTPRMKVMAMTKKKFFFCMRDPPIWTPISLMDCSVPTLNKVIPTTIMTAAIKKE